MPWPGRIELRRNDVVALAGLLDGVQWPQPRSTSTRAPAIRSAAQAHRTAAAHASSSPVTSSVGQVMRRRSAGAASASASQVRA